MTTKQKFEWFMICDSDYVGGVKMKKIEDRDGVSFFDCETNGNSYDVADHNGDDGILFYRTTGSRDPWLTNTEQYTVEMDGIPFIAPLEYDSHFSTFAEFLTSAREKLELSVPKFAKMIGVPPRTMENWLADIRIPTALVMQVVYKRIIKIEKLSEKINKLYGENVQTGLVNITADDKKFKNVLLFYNNETFYECNNGEMYLYGEVNGKVYEFWYNASEQLGAEENDFSLIDYTKAFKAVKTHFFDDED